MGKRSFFDTIDDANQRVRNTVIIHKDGPCIVNQIYGMNTFPVVDVTFLPIGRGARVKDIPFNEDNFKVRRLPSLGYVDYSEASYYLTRTPSRQQKQGFCRENILIPSLPEFRTPSWGNLVETKSLVDMLSNNYNSFDEVFSRVSSSSEPIKKAFAKAFAMSIDDLESITLWYRGTKIAICNNFRKSGPVFKLPNRYSYLKEECEESNIKLEAA